MTTFNDIISRLVKFPKAHAKFVNTLSMLEYIGARKILKSQLAESISAEVLAHTAEEIRHAQTLKKVALKMSEGELTSYSDHHLLCGSEACRYIQTIDYSVEMHLKEKNPWINYLYTTLLIEERANKVYPIYETYLAPLGFGNILKSIVREEDSHLQDISKELKDSSEISAEELAALRQIESKAFQEFMMQISTQLNLLEGLHSTTAQEKFSSEAHV